MSTKTFLADKKKLLLIDLELRINSGSELSHSRYRLTSFLDELTLTYDTYSA